ncbi:MAG: PQQ-binding-like beta-propeller repeat protein [Deltaproteobacteria bacterium]|nr:PQQ-binding-like beta-propeller repeat protein [Deltaproteobacteria bacterium]MBN2671710.1 PQQ-binding-like beta-propeller repeat protein [Deltaproteobacteria bacterium]
MKRMWGLLIVLSWLVGCASDECAEGKCIEEVEAEWGASRILALEPNTGELRWGVNFQGETLDILGLQDGGQSVVVVAADPCFDADRRYAFVVDAEVATEAEVLPTFQPETETDLCTEVTVAGAPGAYGFQYLNGFCIGIIPSSGALVAVDPTDNTEEWRSELAAFVHYVYGNAVLAVAQVTIGTLVRYRLYRIAVADGSTIWQFEQPTRMTPVGANNELVFMLDTRPFAVSVVTGDLIWRNVEDWLFLPGQDTGALLGNTLYLTREYLAPSPCIENDTDTQL